MAEPPVKVKGLFKLGIFVLFLGANLFAVAQALSSSALQRKLGVFGLCIGLVGFVLALIGLRSFYIHHCITDPLKLLMVGIVICLAVFLPSLLAMGFLGKLILANGAGVAIVLALLVSRRSGFPG